MFTLNNTVFKNGDVIENIHINAIKNLATASMNLKQEAMEKLTAYQNELQKLKLIIDQNNSANIRANESKYFAQEVMLNKSEILDIDMADKVEKEEIEEADGEADGEDSTQVFVNSSADLSANTAEVGSNNSANFSTNDDDRDGNKYKDFSGANVSTDEDEDVVEIMAEMDVEDELTDKIIKEMQFIKAYQNNSCILQSEDICSESGESDRCRTYSADEFIQQNFEPETNQQMGWEDKSTESE